MKLSRSREHKINMGHYEHTVVWASITVEGLDLYTQDELDQMDPDELQKELQKACEEYLDQNLDPELKEAAKLSQASDSMLFGQPQPAPRREKARS